MIAKRVIFRGRVQGVGFRYAVKQLARSFDVSGWVRNLPDGTVEMQTVGERDEVAAFLGEILEESVVAHHIRSHFAEEVPLPPDVGGFAILP